jgi:hypothetical protein
MDRIMRQLGMDICAKIIIYSWYTLDYRYNAVRKQEATAPHIDCCALAVAVRGIGHLDRLSITGAIALSQRHPLTGNNQMTLESVASLSEMDNVKFSIRSIFVLVHLIALNRIWIYF